MNKLYEYPVEEYDKLLKHDDGYSIRGSEELGWVFVEGKHRTRNSRDQHELLTKSEQRAINRCAKKRHISTIKSNSSNAFYLRDDKGNFVKIDIVACQE